MSILSFIVIMLLALGITRILMREGENPSFTVFKAKAPAKAEKRAILPPRHWRTGRFLKIDAEPVFY